MPATESQIKETGNEDMMNFVFEWIDTGDEEPFARRGKMSIRNLI